MHRLRVKLSCKLEYFHKAYKQISFRWLRMANWEETCGSHKSVRLSSGRVKLNFGSDHNSWIITLCALYIYLGRHTISPTHLNVENTRTENINLSSIEFYHLQIQKILSGLDANKASGPDNLSSRILRKCATVLAQFLTLFFELSFASGHIPV